MTNNSTPGAARTSLVDDVEQELRSSLRGAQRPVTAEEMAPIHAAMMRQLDLTLEIYALLVSVIAGTPELDRTERIQQELARLNRLIAENITDIYARQADR